MLISIFPEEKIKLLEAAKKIKLPDNNRSQFIKNKDQVIFLDAYNANPSSMKAALESFKNYLESNKFNLNDSLFVLGDMNELGKKSSEYHEEIGHSLNELNIRQAIFVGRFSNDYAKGFSGEFRIFTSTEELKKEWITLSEKYSSVFLKGSRTLQLESLMTLLVT